MSERALIYNKDLKLKHKHLVIQEAGGLSDGVGRIYLRQLLSEGKVRYATVQSTKNGLVGEELPPIEGPTGLLMTTTSRSLHPEDESRMLSYHLDENPEKMLEALLSQARLQGRSPKPIDTGPWFALDAMVRSNDKTVTVPFSETLARKLPRTHNRVMRDFPHVISLIQAHALVHQCTRERDDDGSIIATVDDYGAVRDLVEKPLSEGLETAVRQNVREVVEAVGRLVPARDGLRMPYDPDEGVSQRQVAEFLNREPSVISRNVSAAIEQGFLRDLEPGQGRSSRLVMGERQLPSGSVLPEPNELRDRPVGERQAAAVDFEIEVLSEEEIIA
jgi:hypothetical protein